MSRNFSVPRALLLLLVLQALNGCAWLDKTFPDKSKDYQKSQTSTPLDVPPDLTTTGSTDALIVQDGTTTLSEYDSARQSLSVTGAAAATFFPSQKHLRFARDRDRFWLVVRGDPATVWPKVREFWPENGFLIVSEDPRIGTLQTDWVENRASISQGFIRNILGRVLDSVYASSYQDRYRMRLEKGAEPGTTEVYIAHQGVQEIITDATDEGATKWGPRPPDPGLESDMLKKMMIYLGATPKESGDRMTEVQQAPAAPPQAELVNRESGELYLIVHQDLTRAWRSVGIVLDRIDFAVDGRDRTEGLYSVRYSDPRAGHDKGFLSKMAFWSSDEAQQVENYKIRLTSEGDDTRVVVLNEQGQLDNSDTAKRILSLLYEELR